MKDEREVKELRQFRNQAFLLVDSLACLFSLGDALSVLRGEHGRVLAQGGSLRNLSDHVVGVANRFSDEFIRVSKSLMAAFHSQLSQDE